MSGSYFVVYNAQEGGVRLRLVQLYRYAAPPPCTKANVSFILPNSATFPYPIVRDTSPPLPL